MPYYGTGAEHLGAGIERAGQTIGNFLKETPQRDFVTIQQLRQFGATLDPPQRKMFTQNLTQNPMMQRIAGRNPQWFDQESGALLMPDTVLKDIMRETILKKFDEDPLGAVKLLTKWEPRRTPAEAGAIAEETAFRGTKGTIEAEQQFGAKGGTKDRAGLIKLQSALGSSLSQIRQLLSGAPVTKENKTAASTLAGLEGLSKQSMANFAALDSILQKAKPGTEFILPSGMQERLETDLKEVYAQYRAVTQALIPKLTPENIVELKASFEKLHPTLPVPDDAEWQRRNLTKQLEGGTFQK